LLVPVLCPFLAYMHFIVCCLLPLFWIYAFYPYTLATPAWSCTGLQQPHPVLALCCFLCLPCYSARLPCQQCGSHCGSFCDYLTTVPCKDPGWTHPPAFQQGNKIALLSHCLLQAGQTWRESGQCDCNSPPCVLWSSSTVCCIQRFNTVTVEVAM